MAVCPEVLATHVGAGTGGDPVARETHFQASHERYVRKHHGTLGWWSYRAAVLTGAAARTIVLPGRRRQDAALRLRLLRTGPLRAEAALGRSGLRVAQVVVTDAFAGVERYVCQVANGLAARGHQVDVIGGAPVRMRAELDHTVTHRPAATLAAGTRALVGARGADLVHVHMTSAEASAFLARPFTHAPDRGHPALRRRPGLVARPPGAGPGRRPDPSPPTSPSAEFVAASVPGPTTLIHNGVVGRPQAPLDRPVVVMLQRLDRGEGGRRRDPGLGGQRAGRSGLASGGGRAPACSVPTSSDLADRLDCRDSVEFAGQVADTDALLAGSSVLLAPAPAEPFGLSVVEAMSHGLAVVAADGGAHGETVGEDGLLFPPGDVDGAARALDRLAVRPRAAATRSATPCGSANSSGSRSTSTSTGWKRSTGRWSPTRT